jgi:8-oxo-dGTP diphosphatase
VSIGGAFRACSEPDCTLPVVFGSPTPGISYTERPAAYVVVTNNEGMVAVIHGKHGYFLPGGGSLPGEEPEVTLLREVREELARGIRILGRLGEAIQYFSAQAQHFKMHAVFFAAEFTDEPSGYGEHELHWLHMAEADGEFFHESHVWAIRQIT